MEKKIILVFAICLVAGWGDHLMLVDLLNVLVTMVGVDIEGMGHKELSPQEPDNFTKELQA